MTLTRFILHSVRPNSVLWHEFIWHIIGQLAYSISF